ncbi:hypothetical protein D3C86_2093750 [compost metagenome]
MSGTGIQGFGVGSEIFEIIGEMSEFGAAGLFAANEVDQHILIFQFKCMSIKALIDE